MNLNSYKAGNNKVLKVYLYIAALVLTWPIYGQPSSDSWSAYKDLTFYELELNYDEALEGAAVINYIREDKDGILWMGSREGSLLRFNGHSIIDIKEYINQAQSNVLVSNTITALSIDQSQDIWLGSSEGLYKVRQSDLFCSKIILDEPLHAANFRNYITDIVVQGDTLFIGTQNGLYLIDRISGEKLKGFFNDGDQKVHIREGTQNNVGGIYPGKSSKQIWFSMNNRIYQLNTISGAYQEYIADFVKSDQRRFLKGNIYPDSLLLIPTESSGMVSFDLKNQSFSRCLIDDGKYSFFLNNIGSALPVNDTFSLITAFDWGTGLFNRHTCEVQWMSVPSFLQFGSHRLFKDQLGFAWAGIGGKIFRSNRAINNKKNSAPSPIIDVSVFFANDTQKGNPALEAYPTYELGEYERSIKIIFSLTRAHAFEDISYEYQLNGKEWQLTETPNQVTFTNPVNGKNELIIRAIADNQVIASRILSFRIYFPFYKTAWFYLFITVALLSIGYGVARFRINQVRKEERLKGEFEKKLAEIESMALRSQINPHFIFNTLNSIKYYAIKKNPSETGEFINHFSALIRQILENSKKNLIPLHEEIETLSNYIEVEKLRFRNAFKSNIEVDPNIDQDFFMIPPSLLQPFVENAIWHGLMHKEGDKQLNILFSQEENKIICEIIDNGIGREASAKIHTSKTHKTSLGVSITQERIRHLETVHGIKSDFEIIDLYDESGDPAGTKVIVDFSI